MGSNQMVSFSGPGNLVVNFQICSGTTTTCQADFFAIPDSSNPVGSYSVYFVDMSQGSPITWSWDFGDGTTGNSQFASHTYTQAGTYQVCLTITTASSCTSTYCQTVTVSAPSSCTADFYDYPDTNNTYGVYFANYSIGNIVNYLWDFGDGSTSTQVSPTHVYAASGVYYVCLTVSDNSGSCFDTYCGNVYVGNPVFCQAYLVAFPDSSGNNTYQFYNASSGTNAGTSYAWSFGDGNTSSLENPTHTYATTGTYSVCLTISDSSCSSTFCDSLWVGILPCYNYFSYNSQGLAANFTGVAYNGTGPYTYSWDFGDGGTATGASVSHTFATPGYYTVTLTTSDAAGCTYVSAQYIYFGSVLSFIYGQVSANGNYLDYGKVELYVQNPSTLNLYLADTVMIDSSGLYWFDNVLPGTYFILASPSSNSAYYTTHAPTYYQSSIFWASATPIVVGQPINPYNISLAALLGPNAGPGSISGTLSQGAKLFAQGPPMPNVEVMLLNTSNQALAMVYTNAAGQFSFNNLAMGTYKVYTEITGIPTTPAIVTLSTSNPSNSNVSIVWTPAGITTGIDDQPGIEGLVIGEPYPNPASELVTLRIESLQSSTLTASIADLSGKVVVEQLLTIGQGVSDQQLDVSRLQTGLYTLTLSLENGQRSSMKLSVIK
jgi:PKD repeat protein